jgi:hypothetical protein
MMNILTYEVSTERGQGHLPGLSARRELRVIAADLGVAERGTVGGPAVHGHDGGVDVDRQRRRQIRRTGPAALQPGQ